MVFNGLNVFFVIYEAVYILDCFVIIFSFNK